ncbi:hypothetical protein Tco_0641095 [Tanacetum coccineum]
MSIYKMNMEQFQVNIKFLNSLPPEQSKFVTDFKLVKGLHTTNFNQLHAYLEQHELHANEVRSYAVNAITIHLHLLHNRQMITSHSNLSVFICLVVVVFSLGDDPIACINKAMAFLIDVASSSLDTYDSDCDDISNAQAVLMANISNYGFDVISEVSHYETNLNDMENQSVLAMQDFKQSPVVDFTDNEIHSDSNIIPYS